MASRNNGDFVGSPIRCNQTPSPDSNSEAPVCAFGMPTASDGDGCSTRRQCIAIGTSAPWAMLVWAGPARPVRSRAISRATMPIALRWAAHQLPIGHRRKIGPSR